MMSLALALFATVLIVILLPWILRLVLMLVFGLQMVYKHGFLFPKDSDADKKLLEREFLVWFEPLDKVVRPFDWSFWWQVLYKKLHTNK